MHNHRNRERPEELGQLRRSRSNADRGLTTNLSENTPVDRIRGRNNVTLIDDEGIGEVLGSATGEGDRDVTAGGWAGTDDATSTAPSDLADEMIFPEAEDPDATIGRGYAGGLAQQDGGVSDLTGNPVEESRNWNVDSLVI